MLAGRGQGPFEQVAVRQWAGRVVHGDHGDRSRVDLVGQHAQRRPLGGVPGVPAGDEQHLAVPQVRRQGGLHRRVLVGAVHDDHPAYGGQRQGGPDRPGDHRDAPERQQHLVDLGTQPGAGAGRDHHHGGVGPALGVAHGAKPSQHSYRCRNTPKHALNTRDLPSRV